MEEPGNRAPTVHPAVVGSRCKKCGALLSGDTLYIIVKQMGKTSPKQDSVCLECLGLLLLTSDKVIEALAEKLLKAMGTEEPPGIIPGAF